MSYKQQQQQPILYNLIFTILTVPISAKAYPFANIAAAETKTFVADYENE